MPQVQTRDLPESDSKEIIIRISNNELMNGGLDLTAAMQEGAKEVAKEYIADHMIEVLVEMNPVAVANLAIAESAQLIRTKFIDPPKKEEKA